MLKIIKGDIVSLHKQGKTIAHGCNCLQNWKQVGGVARILYKEFPSIGEHCTPVLGWVSVHNTNFGIVINAYTQFYGGANFDLEALRNCISSLEVTSANDIYIPAIGCGIGGGNWMEVCKVLANSKIQFTMVLR